ncbi:MAG: thioredoxin domain-containing protein [Christensenellales bacterium]|jgi:uncharacterized protein YyaL (SSP411 family)|nr:thioredoxin domain-containing protein [Eubacteriales bacterium]
MSNRLKDQASPYLLQHAENPVNWYPWGEEAFSAAKKEDKPVFLSVGYSTCHWCHVMGRECFEDAEVADALNRAYISIKVDKEERPDIDAAYMEAALMLTGAGGWPLTAVLTPDKAPIFVGTYFPKHSTHGRSGLLDILAVIEENWRTDKERLIKSGQEIVNALNTEAASKNAEAEDDFVHEGLRALKRAYEPRYGGFSRAPKFPTPHNILFLLSYFERFGDGGALDMAEHTLQSMYRGGIFDHVGYGFSRYSTDDKWLVPHFEKMLYDNALLAVCYLEAYRLTQNPLYKSVAEKTLAFLSRDMAADGGAFYTALDADSEGGEGNFYVFTREELVELLGSEDGERFCEHFGVDKKGNFEGKNVLNLLDADILLNPSAEKLIPAVFQYRNRRSRLFRDEKILTAWNAMAAYAFTKAYRILGGDNYLKTAKGCLDFIEKNHYDGIHLFVSSKGGKRSREGFLEDYAYFILALTELYRADFDDRYLDLAQRLNSIVIKEFWDDTAHGFYLYGKSSENLITRPKEVHDGAYPSGNSVMALNLLSLSRLKDNTALFEYAEKQADFIYARAKTFPAGYGFYLYGLLQRLNEERIICVLKDKADLDKLRKNFTADITVLFEPTKSYPLINDRTTFYRCDGGACYAPEN